MRMVVLYADGRYAQFMRQFNGQARAVKIWMQIMGNRGHRVLRLPQQ